MSGFSLTVARTRRRGWGSDESGSGIGSELGATEALREYLPGLFKRLGVRKVLDAPCGDCLEDGGHGRGRRLTGFGGRGPGDGDA